MIEVFTVPLVMSLVTSKVTFESDVPTHSINSYRASPEEVLEEFNKATEGQPSMSASAQCSTVLTLLEVLNILEFNKVALLVLDFHRIH